MFRAVLKMNLRPSTIIFGIFRKNPMRKFLKLPEMQKSFLKKKFKNLVVKLGSGSFINDVY
jgi:hypothetical protein